MSGRVRLAFVVFCTAVYLCTTPGRIMFPDDEIVFQTTQSLWEDGDLAIRGMPQRSGEPSYRPAGTFGWAHGRDGRRYGFFGHALSIVALPLYGAGKLMAERAPEPWRHAVRSDHYMYHRRSQAADWTRLVVSFTNSIVTAVAAWLLVAWARVLGFSTVASVTCGLLYAFGSLAWPYSRTFLSEPLSALVLLATALCVARFHHHRARGPTRSAKTSLWAAGLLSGISVHVHVLNVVALPCLLAYAIVPLVRERRISAERRAWVGSVALAAAGAALLGLSQYVRFGDAWETGRYGHYSTFASPWESLPALLLGPGRSFLLYSPVTIVGVFGWAALRRRAPTAAWFALAIVATRLVFVACRSDWWGGWGVGPRFLVPVVPFAVLPVAAVIDRVRIGSQRLVIAFAVAVSACVVVEAHLAAHSIWEWMHVLAGTRHSWGSGYMQRSHWLPSATPIAGYFTIKPDMLSIGAFQLLRHGHPGMAWAFTAVMAIGVAAGAILVRSLARPSSQAHR